MPFWRMGILLEEECRMQNQNKVQTNILHRYKLSKKYSLTFSPENKFYICPPFLQLILDFVAWYSDEENIIPLS